MSEPQDFPYIWAWGSGPVGRLIGRKGMRCRVLARGKRNSCLLEFEDGFKTVTSRNGLRRFNDREEGKKISTE